MQNSLNHRLNGNVFVVLSDCLGTAAKSFKVLFYAENTIFFNI